MLTIILGILVWIELLVIIRMYFRKTRSYSGEIRVIHTPEGMTFSLELAGDPAELEIMDEVKFKVIALSGGSRDGNIG